MTDSFFAAAECKGMDPEIFNPAKGDVRTEHQARTVCRACPVKTDCLEWALTTNQTHGIWGDTSEKQRRKLRRDRRTASGLGGRGPVPTPVVHGDHRSYRKCCALNDGRACVACREAMVRYRGGKRNRASERAGDPAVQCSTCGRLCGSTAGLAVHRALIHQSEAA
jgi:WhiB family transcriptional regulator, redox-sensing transcriptional regulator